MSGEARGLANKACSAAPLIAEHRAIAEREQRARQAQLDQDQVGRPGSIACASRSGRERPAAGAAAANAISRTAMSSLIEAARNRSISPIISGPAQVHGRPSVVDRPRPPSAAPADGRASAGRAKTGRGDRSSAAGPAGGLVASSFERGAAAGQRALAEARPAPSIARRATPPRRCCPPPPRKIASRWRQGRGRAAAPAAAASRRRGAHRRARRRRGPWSRSTSAIVAG